MYSANHYQTCEQLFSRVYEPWQEAIIAERLSARHLILLRAWSHLYIYMYICHGLGPGGAPGEFLGTSTCAQHPRSTC